MIDIIALIAGVYLLIVGWFLGQRAQRAACFRPQAALGLAFFAILIFFLGIALSSIGLSNLLKETIA